MSDPREPGHPIGSEIDDSQNPTAASPADEPGAASHGDSRRAKEMMRQLQQMIDQLSAQAGPPMRDLAAKAAELAAVAAQRAGPLAVKAAEKTQVYGERFAARSKEMAADLRTKSSAGESGAPSSESVAAANAGGATAATADNGGEAAASEEWPAADTGQRP